MDELRLLKKLAFLLAMPGITLLVLLPLFIKEMGGSSELVGIASSVGPLSFAIIRLIGGAATDIFGRKSTFVFGTALYTLGLLLLALSTNADLAAIAGSLCGAGAMLAMTSAIVIVADITGSPETYGKLTSDMALGGIVGSIIPFVVLEFLGNKGFRLSFLIYFIVSLYATLLSLKLPETKPKEARVKFEFSWYWLMAVIVGSLVATASGMVTPFFPLYIKEKFGISATEVMLAYVPSALGAVGGPRAAGYLDPAITLIAFNLLGSLGSFSIILDSLIMASLGFALVTAAIGASSVAQDSLVAKGCKRSCGLMVGLYSAITQGFMGLGSLYAGFIFSSSKDSVFIQSTLLFLLASILAVIGFIGLRYLSR